MPDEVAQNLVVEQKQGGESKFTALFRFSEHWGWTVLGVVLVVVGWWAIAPADHLAQFASESDLAYVHINEPDTATIEQHFPEFVDVPGKIREVAAMARPGEQGVTWIKLARVDGKVISRGDVADSKILETSKALQPWRYHFRVTGFVTPAGIKALWPELDIPPFIPGQKTYFGFQQNSNLVYGAVAEKPTWTAGFVAFVTGLLRNHGGADISDEVAYGSVVNMPMVRWLLPDWFKQANETGRSELMEFKLAEQNFNQAMAAYPATWLENLAGPEIFLRGATVEAISKNLVGAKVFFPGFKTVKFEDDVEVTEFITNNSGLSLSKVEVGNFLRINYGNEWQLGLIGCKNGVVVSATEPTCPENVVSQHMHSARGITLKIPSLFLKTFPEFQKLSTVFIDQVVDNFVTIVMN